MDRRSFLKSMGLGGMSLLMPKPLEIVAARMAQISGPPVHAGLCRFRGVQDFTFKDVGIILDGWQQKNSITVERYRDLVQNWTVHLGIRWGTDAYEKIAIKPMRNSLFCMEDRKELPGMGFRIKKADAVDVWAVPQGTPLFPLPSLTVCMFGPFLSPSLPRDYASLAMRSVRLERGRALELGLAAPADPFEIV